MKNLCSPEIDYFFISVRLIFNAMPDSETIRCAARFSATSAKYLSLRASHSVQTMLPGFGINFATSGAERGKARAKTQ